MANLLAALRSRRFLNTRHRECALRVPLRRGLHLEWLEHRYLLTGTSNAVYLISTTGGQVDGVSFRDEDILLYDGQSDSWSTHFDGSDVGLGSEDVNAFHIQSDNSVLMSFDSSAEISGVESVRPADIAKFNPTSLGENTAGSFEMFFDGSDVGLTNSFYHNIDAIGFAPDGRLVISTSSSFTLSNLPGLFVDDSDLIAFNATSFGQNTSGSFESYFEGPDVDLDRFAEDVNGTWINDQQRHRHLRPR